MKYRINWSNIKDGYKGFEKLAVQYVQYNYDSRFKHTGDTRDGNKDAYFSRDEYTIIMGFQQSKNIVEEWWMEAKYSKTKERITRYRLDATLVSAILKGIVGRIIFVTNINIDAQTVNDIRQAITHVTRCKEVDFCTRDCLEYWLYQNTNILKDFFLDYHYDEIIELSSLMLIEQMDFFASDNSNLVFRESLSVLDIGRTYKAQFAIYSKTQQEFRIQAGNHLKGIINLHPKKLNLKSGINWIKIHFKLSTNYGYKSAKRKEMHSQLPAPSFTIGSINVVSKRNITVSTKVYKNYIIPSQNNLLCQMKKYFETFTRNNNTQIFYINGQSGVGKSYILDTFIEYVSQSNILLFSCEMTESQKNNLNNLIRCLNFIYFPFLPSDSINKDYLDCMRNEQFFSTFYYDIICCENDAESIGQLLSRYIAEDISLFPRKLYVNPRLIIIDNIHKANELIINSFYKIAMELSRINAPYMLILSGQRVKYTQYYAELLKNLLVLECELRITTEDCLSLLSKDKIHVEIETLLQSNFLFTNMIELLFFTKYILEHGNDVKDFNTFTTLYHLFFLERIMDNYIGHIFMEATHGDDLADELCNEIYWSSSGVEGTDQPAGRKLLSYHVAKIDSLTGRLIPYHDIYTNYYRKNYNYRSVLEIPFIELLEVADSNKLKDAIDKIHKAFESQQFIFVYYTLEPLYRDASLTTYRNLINETVYYTLFYEYALSCAHCSMDYSGQHMFAHIYSETKTLLNPSHQIRKICNAALWELTNSTFEALDYSQAVLYAEELIKNTSELLARHIIKGSLHDCVRYHNANVILSMIKSELQENDNNTFYDLVSKDMLINGFEGRYWSYNVRYSLTLMQSNPQKAMCILSSCCKHYEKDGKHSDKYFMWSHFYLSYMKMIINNDFSSEDNALFYMECLHNSFFNDYRKIMFGMATYFYYQGDIKRGDSILLSDCHVLRKKRPRLQGFYHLTNAIRYVMTNNKSCALVELENASAILGHIPSYNKLIQHNISVLRSETIELETTSNVIKKHILYYFGGPLKEDMYYLEIRGCW